jgi:hypothetical protein
MDLMNNKKQQSLQVSEKRISVICVHMRLAGLANDWKSYWRENGASRYY